MQLGTLSTCSKPCVRTAVYWKAKSAARGSACMNVSGLDAGERIKLWEKLSW